VPWWNGTRAICGEELLRGAEQVGRLIKLLPKLRAVVLVGKRAQRAKPYLAGCGTELLASDHPSVPFVGPSEWSRGACTAIEALRTRCKFEVLPIAGVGLQAALSVLLVFLIGLGLRSRFRIGK